MFIVVDAIETDGDEGTVMVVVVVVVVVVVLLLQDFWGIDRNDGSVEIVFPRFSICRGKDLGRGGVKSEGGNLP